MKICIIAHCLFFYTFIELGQFQPWLFDPESFLIFYSSPHRAIHTPTQCAIINRSVYKRITLPRTNHSNKTKLLCFKFDHFQNKSKSLQKKKNQICVCILLL